MPPFERLLFPVSELLERIRPRVGPLVGQVDDSIIQRLFPDFTPKVEQTQLALPFHGMPSAAELNVDAAPGLEAALSGGRLSKSPIPPWEPPTPEPAVPERFGRLPEEFDVLGGFRRSPAAKFVSLPEPLPAKRVATGELPTEVPGVITPEGHAVAQQYLDILHDRARDVLDPSFTTDDLNDILKYVGEEIAVANARFKSPEMTEQIALDRLREATKLRSNPERVQYTSIDPVLTEEDLGTKKFLRERSNYDEPDTGDYLEALKGDDEGFDQIVQSYKRPGGSVEDAEANAVRRLQGRPGANFGRDDDPATARLRLVDRQQPEVFIEDPRAFKNIALGSPGEQLRIPLSNTRVVSKLKKGALVFVDNGQGEMQVVRVRKVTKDRFSGGHAIVHYDAPQAAPRAESVAAKSAWQHRADNFLAQLPEAFKQKLRDKGWDPTRLVELTHTGQPGGFVGHSGAILPIDLRSNPQQPTLLKVIPKERAETYLREAKRAREAAGLRPNEVPSVAPTGKEPSRGRYGIAEKMAALIEQQKPLMMVQKAIKEGQQAKIVAKLMGGEAPVKKIPMYYKMAPEAVRSDLRAKYPQGTSTAELIKNGDRIATTRKKFADVGEVIEIEGVPGKFKVVAVEKPNLSTPEGRQQWAAREGWDPDYILRDAKLRSQALSPSVVQTVFERISE